MIIVTSISGRHSNQNQSIESWKQYGDCYSLNSAKEIEQLKPLYEGITFVETSKTIEHLIGKPLVTINAMIDFAINWKRDLLIVNSDIILKDLPVFKDDGITMFSRYDYTRSFEDAKIFPLGFDVFYIPYKFLKIFPHSPYALGATWFDYFLPYRCILAEIPLYYAKGKHAYHKKHELNYPMHEWEAIGEYFRWEFKLPKKVYMGQIATNTLALIKSKMIHV